MNRSSSNLVSKMCITKNVQVNFLRSQELDTTSSRHIHLSFTFELLIHSDIYNLFKVLAIETKKSDCECQQSIWYDSYLQKPCFFLLHLARYWRLKNLKYFIGKQTSMLRAANCKSIQKLHKSNITISPHVHR